MPEIPFLEFAIGFALLLYIIETYLNYRHFNKFHETKIPESLKEQITQEKFDTSRSYGIVKMKFTFFKEFVQIVETCLTLFLFGIPFVWKKSFQIVSFLGFDESYEV
jgi:hypothetical protein